MSQQQTKFKVLLIGDSCIDEYHYGTVSRLSPEAPVPILNTERLVFRDGMALNVRNNLQAFGLDVVNHTPYPVTTRKIRYVDSHSGQHLLRVDVDSVSAPLRDIANLTDFDAVVISDYCKGYVDYELIEFIVKAPVPVFIDTKKTDLARMGNAFVKINSIEHKKLASVCENLIVTHGSEGAYYKNVRFPGCAVEVSDVCGAGDTFLSALVFQYLSTNDIESAISFANIAASVSVQHSGTYVLTATDVNRILEYYENSSRRA
jgi:bifunctional ADP-heptose synthase (sugar kinase/adenylyltransferase)